MVCGVSLTPTAPWTSFCRRRRSWLAYDRPGVASDRSSRKPSVRGVPDTIEMPGFTAASRQIVGKPTPTGFAQNQKPEPHRGSAFAFASGFCFCRRRRSWLAYDRLRSSRKPGERGVPDTTEVPGLAAAARQIVGKLTPRPAARIKSLNRVARYTSPRFG
jgi:hypothetical protein